MSVLKIDDNLLSLGTNSKGVIVVNENFDFLYKVGLEQGLKDAAIKAQFVDNEKTPKIS